jgi:hypothetical protein
MNINFFDENAPRFLFEARMLLSFKFFIFLIDYSFVFLISVISYMTTRYNFGGLVFMIDEFLTFFMIDLDTLFLYDKMIYEDNN